MTHLRSMSQVTSDMNLDAISATLNGTGDVEYAMRTLRNLAFKEGNRYAMWSHEATRNALVRVAEVSKPDVLREHTCCCWANLAFEDSIRAEMWTHEAIKAPSPNPNANPNPNPNCRLLEQPCWKPQQRRGTLP